MTIREKSAWGMAILMALTGLYYASIAATIPADAPVLAQLGPLLPYVLLVVIGSIAVQVFVTASSYRDAGKPADERERQAIDRAGNWSGTILGAGVVTAIFAHLATNGSASLVLWTMGALILAQVAEYVLQIVFFRTGV